MSEATTTRAQVRAIERLSRRHGHLTIDFTNAGAEDGCIRVSYEPNRAADDGVRVIRPSGLVEEPV